MGEVPVENWEQKLIKMKSCKD